MLLLLLVRTAAAAEVGLGAWSSNVGEGPDVGLRGYGAVRLLPPLSLQLGASVRAPLPPGSDFDRTLVAIGYEVGRDDFSVPISTDTLSVDLLLDWSFVAREATAGVSGGLHLLGGLSGRSRSDYVGTFNSGGLTGYPSADPLVVTPAGSHLAVGPSAGFALDVAFGRHWGVRSTLLGRVALEAEPVYSTSETADERVLDGSGVSMLDVGYRW